MNIPFDLSWTLFLDRDGVVNKRIPGQYIRQWDEFEFLPGVLEALAIFSEFFGRIVVATNQQGIGKGLMTEAELEKVHLKMLQEVHAAGGRIDKIYYCPEMAKDNPPCRKPNPGMAYQAQEDFPEIDFEKSLMVGDSLSDMQFAQKLGMQTLFIETNPEEKKKVATTMKEEPGYSLNYCFDSLLDFATFLSR